jgi:hypothetical protein
MCPELGDKDSTRDTRFTRGVSFIFLSLSIFIISFSQENDDGYVPLLMAGDVETKDDFVKYMSQIGWVANGFVDFSIPEAGEFGFVAMDAMKVKTVSEKVGLFDEVIVYLARKVFSHTIHSVTDEIGCDNKKFEIMVRIYHVLFFTCFLVEAYGAYLCGIYHHRSESG